MSEVTATDQNFTEEIKKFEGIALVDFYADWCGPCKMQGPIIEALAEETEGNESIKIAKLNVDENQTTAQEFNVMSIPTLILFKNGSPVDQLTGVNQKEVLLEKINALLDA